MESGQQFPAECEPSGTEAIGEKAEVANAHESLGENVQKESTLELNCTQRHYFLLTTVRAIFPSEGDSLSIERNQAMIGDGHTVGISAQVAQDVDGVAKRWLAVNYPFL